jgi:hypothetical protein
MTNPGSSEEARPRLGLAAPGPHTALGPLASSRPPNVCQGAKVTPLPPDYGESPVTVAVTSYVFW